MQPELPHCTNENRVGKPKNYSYVGQWEGGRQASVAPLWLPPMQDNAALPMHMCNYNYNNSVATAASISLAYLKDAKPHQSHTHTHTHAASTRTTTVAITVTAVHLAALA